MSFEKDQEKNRQNQLKTAACLMMIVVSPKTVLCSMMLTFRDDSDHT